MLFSIIFFLSFYPFFIMDKLTCWEWCILSSTIKYRLLNDKKSHQIILNELKEIEKKLFPHLEKNT